MKRGACKCGDTYHRRTRREQARDLLCVWMWTA